MMLAAVLLAQAAWAEDARDGATEEATVSVAVATGHDLAPGCSDCDGPTEGIAVGEPDPSGVEGTDGLPDIVIDDGAFLPGDEGWDDTGFDDGSDGSGDSGVDDGSDGSDDSATDDGSGDAATDDGEAVVFILGEDGSCINCVMMTTTSGGITPETAGAKRGLTGHVLPQVPADGRGANTSTVARASGQGCSGAAIAWLCSWQKAASR